MKFLADESMDRQIIIRLRQDGHAVLDVTEMDPGIFSYHSRIISYPQDQYLKTWTSPFFAPLENTVLVVIILYLSVPRAY